VVNEWRLGPIEILSTSSTVHADSQDPVGQPLIYNKSTDATPCWDRLYRDLEKYKQEHLFRSMWLVTDLYSEIWDYQSVRRRHIRVYKKPTIEVRAETVAGLLYERAAITLTRSLSSDGTVVSRSIGHWEMNGCDISNLINYVEVHRTLYREETFTNFSEVIRSPTRDARPSHTQ
jgi:hypothetical protein